MATKPKTKSRTSNSKLNKKVHFPLWSVIVGILVLVGVGIFLVYNSFAAGPTIHTVYCQQNSSTRCASAAWQGSGGYNEPRSAYIRYNASCNMGQKEFRIVGGSKNSWHCLFDGA